MHCAAHSWGQMETTCVLLPSRTHSSLWVSLKGEWCSCRRSVWRVMRPQGTHFLQGIFFLSWSLRFSIYHDSKKSSWFLVTCSNRGGGIEAQIPVQGDSKAEDCFSRYNHKRALEGASKGYINVCTYKTACHLLQNITEGLCPKRSTSIPYWSARRGVL